MPEHVHLLVLPMVRGPTVSKLLYAIKQPFAYRVRRELQATDDPLLRSLMVPARGRLEFRFWQSGPGFDTNLRSDEEIGEVRDYIHSNPVRRGLVTQPLEYPRSSSRQFAAPESTADPWRPSVALRTH